MFEKQIKIPSAEEIVDRMPLPANLKKIKSERDSLVADVISGKSDKLLIIVGPCSAHEAKPVLEYVERLGKLNERTSSCSFPEFTPTSRAPRAWATRACFRNPTPISRRIF